MSVFSWILTIIALHQTTFERVLMHYSENLQSLIIETSWQGLGTAFKTKVYFQLACCLSGALYSPCLTEKFTFDVVFQELKCCSFSYPPHKQLIWGTTELSGLKTVKHLTKDELWVHHQDSWTSSWIPRKCISAMNINTLLWILNPTCNLITQYVASRQQNFFFPGIENCIILRIKILLFNRQWGKNHYLSLISLKGKRAMH